MKPTSQILREARELIRDPKKWCKLPEFKYVAGDRLCVNMALCMAQGEPTSVTPRSPACYLMRAANIPAMGFDDIPALILLFRWNDAPEREHGDIMVAFTRAAEFAEADEAASASSIPLDEAYDEKYDLQPADIGTHTP